MILPRSAIAKDDAFCSQCGAACPTVEPEEDAGDDVIEGTAEEVAEETATEETDETVEEANADTAEDAVTTEETVEEAAEAEFFTDKRNRLKRCICMMLHFSLFFFICSDHLFH